MSASTIEYDGRRCMLAIVRDISERRERERELERTERQFEVTFNNPVSFMGLLDPDGTVRRINENAREFVGVTEEDVAGEKFWETPWFAHSETVRENVRDAVARAAAGEYVQAELPHQSPDGETVVMDAMLEPVRDDGDVVTILASGHDVTERVRHEEGLREAYEIIADPGLSFGEQIDGLLELGRKTLGVDYATLSRIHESTGDYIFERVASPEGGDLKAGDTTALEATNCERVVTTNENLALRDVGSDAPELADRAGNAEWGISCYLGTPVTVDVDVGPDAATVHVIDNGPGVPERMKESIFEKGEKGYESAGTGFGLHLVREIVDVYDGSITVQDRDPTGSIFSITLPRTPVDD